MKRQPRSDSRRDSLWALVAIAPMVVAALASPALAQDSDGDGVPDVRDVCPTTEMGLAVDGAGCDSFCEVDDLTTDVFLRSRLLEVGTAVSASFGTTVAPPAGWHQRVSMPASPSDSLGFVANPQNNDWASYNGDFFVPGDPEEGWGFQVDGGTNRFNGTLVGANDIPGGFTGTRVECEPRVCGRRGGGSVFWSGARDNIRVDHTYSVLNEGLFILVEARITNNDSFAHTVTYYRNVDPDNQQPLTGDFNTSNTIVSQGDGTPTSVALVTATTSAVAGTADASFLALVSNDPDARVSTGGFTNRSADQVWDCTGPGFLCTPGDMRTADEAVSLAVRKTIPAGDSVTFLYAYTLDTVSVSTASACTVSAVCGDGTVEGTESCDDGNTTSGDGCSSTCEIEDLATCGNGILEDFEDCDDGNDDASDGCALCEVEVGFVCTGQPSVCVPGTGGPGTSCALDSQCTDNRCVDGFCCESTCGGSSSDCQACAAGDTGAANGLCRPIRSGRTCRDATDVCDAVEMCDGSSNACPADGLRSSSAVCRPRAGPCDVPETCTGASAGCPPDGLAGAATVCRPAVGACDVPEVCSGRRPQCPLNVYAAASTVCRAAAPGGCDVTEICSGTGPACPLDGFEADGTSCADSLACNGEEVCGAGTCTPTMPPSCDDANLCTSDMCAEPGGCASVPIAGCCNIDRDCDDSNACTADVCGGPGGTCSSSPITGCCLSDGDCDDMNLCTDETCDLGTNRCVVTPVASCCGSDADCTDSNVCTADSCDVTTGTCANPRIAECCLTDGDCNDANTCTMDACDTATNTCTNDPLAGCCLTDADCGDANACTADTCNSVTAACVNDVIPGCCAADSECDDADECTTDRCDSATSTCAFDAIMGCTQMDGGVPSDAGIPPADDAGSSFDGGVASGDASAGSDSGASGDGAVGDAGLDPTEGGCGCRVTAPRGAPLAWLALLGVLGFIRRRRR